MNTLAKAKAQALVQPPKPLAVTPNVRQFNSPAAGAALSLSNEATNIVQVVNPASTLTINVDGQNFSAFGANHLVLHVDTTAATEITLNFVRGATVLATKAIELEADQLAVLTFAAVIKANNTVTLLALGQHVVGKSAASPSDEAGAGLLLVNAVYANSVLQYTSGQVEGLSTNSMFARVDLTEPKTVSIILPEQPYAIMAILSTATDYMQAMAQAYAQVNIFDGLLRFVGLSDLAVSVGNQVVFSQVDNQMAVRLNGSEPHLSVADSLIDGTRPVYLYLFVTNHFNESPTVPSIPMAIATEALPVAEQ